ncbi:hypothetical protein [Arthrobacter sp. zg-Y1110]|uniref:hypothetical protein n=1 Tax=Arthrobacter sp. zg-Y1110 TaxID=2886932 RepID=UPI001D14F52D|nr:hypothetical protein [Arthrobacter sp. zg-Y1110]MCC3292388.1 hypothetical protein [Arthrobacter sp. zg-Y1110]UWX86709.1 hypothetical protein N2K99_17865 [Arthrobacter sp. zg-Y1110]
MTTTPSPKRAGAGFAAPGTQTYEREQNGRFAEKLHGESSVVLTGNMEMLGSRLASYAEEKRDEAVAAGRAATDARVSLAARSIREADPDIATVYLSPKDPLGGALVIDVMDADGKQLSPQKRVAAQDALRRAEVPYDPRFYYGGIDVDRMSQWIPDDFNPDLDREDESQKGARRALVAMNAAKLDSIDPETRVADMLADMRHYANKYGVNFDNAIERSEGYFEEDRNS